jgi:hypothetical protein
MTAAASDETGGWAWLAGARADDIVAVELWGNESAPPSPRATHRLRGTAALAHLHALNFGGWTRPSRG